MFNMLTRFQSSTQLQLELYYDVKKLNNTSLNAGRKKILPKFNIHLFFYKQPVYKES